ncbi:SDR family oxidoreductase (plasmid) [Pedobacter sp. BS3]|uniref:SDR family oxidoreductase n=1 Tax=Pedobacter sp. BS3 TaxID=2567937 RepID=UPI0011ED1EE8|nr:SDR family oxidoreductase [Pedobacter sp. BS3]TZF85741.1 SDR family oxidoreductase [Pedobacter sp. BS3]
MDINLSEKRALVCGSTQGIGLASAKELASMGASVTLLARNEEKLKEVLEQLPVSGAALHHYLIADFSDYEQVKTVISHYTQTHTVDILVNNTGGPKGGLAIDADITEYQQAFSSHLICNQVLVQHVVPGMKRNNWGRIINVISTSVKAPLQGLGVSNTIRAAVANWAKTLSFELGPYGITVNNVLPSTSMTARLKSLIASRAEKEGKRIGDVEKEMVAQIPLGRIGTAEDVAAAVAFLASPAAGYISGINIPVDGGRTPNL